MKIQYLGTAAAEGIPAIFCECDVCKKAIKKGGKEWRTRSQALIDGNILIDFPADTYIHSLQYNIDLTKTTHCLITHSHSDHLYEKDVAMKIPGYSRSDSIFNFYGLDGTMKKLNDYLSGIKLGKTDFVTFNALDLYNPTEIVGYKVTALRAIHDVTAFPCIYIIEDKEGKRLLYGHDTNYFCDEVWDYLEKNKLRLDFVSLDCTQANDPKMMYVGHMNLNDNVKTAKRLREIGCADEKTIFCSNHFSHNGKDVLYEDFSKLAQKEGFITSYDGMTVEF